MVKIDNDGILCCPRCGENTLHQEQVGVYQRDEEDSETGIHAEIDNGDIRLYPHMIGNPSSRRDGIRIFFSCEHCDAISTLTVSQHKGNTYMNHMVVNHNRHSVIHSERGESLESCIAKAIKAWNNAKIQ